nr:MAG TPA: hypothetical protein [Caudoviricetes sp.]
MAHLIISKAVTAILAIAAWELGKRGRYVNRN